MDLLRTCLQKSSPTFWTDYNKPENSLTPDRFTKLQWILKIAVNWTRYGTSYFPPIIRQIAGISWKLGARHYLRVIRDSAKNRLREDPDFDTI
ncbi:MAG TPA: hypothetical protein VJR67_00800 [Candidatus Nitrosopolaris sp.]|nr:hypothetical protein [Candidatus Nitrosopolaris sp.]